MVVSLGSPRLSGIRHNRRLSPSLRGSVLDPVQLLRILNLVFLLTLRATSRLDPVQLRNSR